MQIVRTFDELVPITPRVCLAIGVFDGVHLGHQRVISQARDDARTLNGSSVVLTFDPHPMRVLHPEKAPLLLTSTPHKLKLIEQLNVDACLLLTFDRQFAAQTPEQFLELACGKIDDLRMVCVGTRFRFGRNRTGDVRLMQQVGRSRGFDVHEIPSAELGGEAISSTAVRQHVLHGRLDRAAEMLGRPFSILGTVEKGDGRGRELGYPTANLDPHNEVMPPDGVYAVQVRTGTDVLGGLANLGLRPTFHEIRDDRTLEVHLLDFVGDLYGQDLEVLFLAKIRNEIKFPSAAALREQIASDVDAARRSLG